MSPNLKPLYATASSSQEIPSKHCIPLKSYDLVTLYDPREDDRFFSLNKIGFDERQLWCRQSEFQRAHRVPGDVPAALSSGQNLHKAKGRRCCVLFDESEEHFEFWRIW